MSYQAIPAAPLDDEPARPARSFVTGALVAVAMFAAGAVAGTAVVRRAGAASPMLRAAASAGDDALGNATTPSWVQFTASGDCTGWDWQDSASPKYTTQFACDMASDDGSYAIGVQHGDGIFYTKKHINMNGTVTMPSGGELYFNGRGKFDKEEGIDDSVDGFGQITGHITGGSGAYVGALGGITITTYFADPSDDYKGDDVTMTVGETWAVSFMYEFEK